MSHNYKLHLPNGDIHEIDYELEVNQSNSFHIFLRKLKIQDPKLRLFVSKGQLMESDSSEITPDSFPFLDNATDMYLILPDVESMFKLAKYKSVPTSSERCILLIPNLLAYLVQF